MKTTVFFVERIPESLKILQFVDVLCNVELTSEMSSRQPAHSKRSVLKVREHCAHGLTKKS